MDVDRWATLQTLLGTALDLPPTERAAFVARHAGGDAALAGELSALLAAADAVPAFLDAPAAWSLDAGGPDEDGSDDAADLAGTAIGPYRIVRELGRGGQGRVFLAEREDVGTRVALKLVRGGLAAPEIVRRFLTERRVLATLDHPHIARLLDAGTTEAGAAGERTPYFVMEAVDGEPLTAHVAAHRPPLDERLRLFLQVCAAVQFAHGRLVVHRDLKPSNILVTRGPDGAPAVKLLDFGIAKLLDEGPAADLTQTGHRLLTPEYAAPEQVLGEAVTVATDVYALGVLLYELLADARPYAAAGSLRDVVRAVCDEVPPPPSARAAEPARARALRGDLDTIALRALAKAPADRYPSVEALADDLRRHGAGLPVRARRQTARYRTARFLRRHAAGSAAAALGLALLAGFGVRERALRHTAESARDEARATSELLLDVFGTGGDAEYRADTLRARTLLDGAAGRLDARLHDRPLIKADLTFQLGRIYAGLRFEPEARGRYRAAERLYRAAGAPPAALAAVLYHLGMSLSADGLCREGVGVLDESVRLYRAAGPLPPGDGGSSGMGAVAARGAALGCLGRYDEAIPDLRAVAEADTADEGFILHSLSHFLDQAGHRDEAIRVMAASLARGEAAFPPGHGVVTTRRAVLSRLHAAAGDLPQAERFARRAFDGSRARLGEANERTLMAQDQLARVLLARGRLQGAEAVARAQVAAARRLAGRDVPIRLRGLYTYARVLLALGRPGEAETAARDALALPDPLSGGLLPQRALVYEVLADALRRQGRAAEAAAVERGAAERRTADER